MKMACTSTMIAALQAENKQEQKRLDWALHNSAHYINGRLSYVDKIYNVKSLIVPADRIRDVIDVLITNEWITTTDD